MREMRLNKELFWHHQSAIGNLMKSKCVNGTIESEMEHNKKLIYIEGLKLQMLIRKHNILNVIERNAPKSQLLELKAIIGNLTIEIAKFRQYMNRTVH